MLASAVSPDRQRTRHQIPWSPWQVPGRSFPNRASLCFWLSSRPSPVALLLSIRQWPCVYSKHSVLGVEDVDDLHVSAAAPAANHQQLVIADLLWIRTS